MELGMYIMAPEPVLTAPVPSVCASTYPPIVARQRLGKHVPAAKNTRNNGRIVGRVVSCAVSVVSKETPCLSLYPSVVARQRIGKHVPAATKNCWSRRFLCGPCHIKEK
jgi:hypothetical protein